MRARQAADGELRTHASPAGPEVKRLPGQLPCKCSGAGPHLQLCLCGVQALQVVLLLLAVPLQPQAHSKGRTVLSKGQTTAQQGQTSAEQGQPWVPSKGRPVLSKGQTRAGHTIGEGCAAPRQPRQRAKKGGSRGCTCPGGKRSSCSACCIVCQKLAGSRQCKQTLKAACSRQCKKCKKPPQGHPCLQLCLQLLHAALQARQLAG